LQSQRIFFVLIFKLSKYAFSLVFFYLVVLFYEPESIGLVQFAIAFSALFSFIFNLGFDIAHLKIYPEEENKSSSIGTLLTINSIFIAFSLIFYFFLLLFLNFNLIVVYILVIFIIDLIVQNISTAFSNILIADNELLKGTFPWVVISTSKIVLIVIGLFLFPTNEIVLSLIYLASSLLHCFVLLIYIVPYKIGKPTKKLIHKYLKFTYPLIIFNVVVIISSNIGIVLINFWISTEAVAFYYAGEHLSVFRTVIPTVITTIMVSIFSKNLIENKLERNKQIIKRICKYSCIFYGGAILLSFLYSNYIIILLLGKTYEPSIFIFNVLVLTHIIVINDVGVFTDLNARGLTKLYSIINVLGEIYLIVLIFIFIAPFGLNFGIKGLAIAIFFKYLTYTPIVRLFLWYKFKYAYNFNIFLDLLVIYVIYFANIIFLNIVKINLFTYFYLIPLLMVINIFLYFIILYLLRTIKREDLRYFKLFLNIKSLINMLYKDLSIKQNNFEKNNEK